MKRCVELTTQLEQRIVIHFCFKLGWTFNQIKASLQQVFGARCLSKSSIYHWLREFRQGRTSLTDKARTPRRKTGCCRRNVRAVEDMVAQDRSASIARMSLQSGISPTSIHRILKMDLHLVKKCAKFVPYLLDQDHMDRRVRISNFMTRLTTQCPHVLRNIVTMDEAWVYIYDPLLKVQSKEWMRGDEPRPQKQRKNQYGAKVMVVTFLMLMAWCISSTFNVL